MPELMLPRFCLLGLLPKSRKLRITVTPGLSVPDIGPEMICPAQAGARAR